jgi:MEMO1 family protein
VPARTAKFAQFVETLDGVLRDSGKKVAWVASGDMAHIGRKFDDDYDAEPVLPELAGEDEALMRSMEQCDAESYFRLIAEVDDARKICGLPPVYTMLEAMKLSENAGAKPFVGKVLAYEQWSERPTRSAVSYSSVAYW